MLPETRNIRKQVRRNKQGVEDINDRSNQVFRRISKPAITPDTSSKIFQVRSWAAPFIDKFDDIYDRPGVYNCVEMIINNKLFDNYVTGTQSPLWSSSAPNRITDKSGAVDEDYTINLDPFSGNSDYNAYSGSTAYIVGDVVELFSEYTESNNSLLRRVSRIYIATKANTAEHPLKFPDSWRELTIEVFNLPEQYTQWSEITPKLAKFDIISGTARVDNTNTSRWVGVDTVGSAKAFHLDPDATTGGNPVGNLAYGRYAVAPTDSTAIEGELGYNVNLYVGDWSNDFPWDEFTQPLSLVGLWINGLWWLSHALPQISGQFGIEYSGTQLKAKVDTTTIDFNGSGELEVI